MITFISSISFSANPNNTPWSNTFDRDAPPCCSPCSVVVASENGKVECENIAGDVEARTHNGGIYCKRIDGGIVARTKNGPILVDGRDATEGFPIHLETDNGPIKLRLAEGASFNLVARTSNGQVRTGVAIDGVVPRGARRELAGPVGSGGPTVELRSANGSIYLNNS